MSAARSTGRRRRRGAVLVMVAVAMLVLLGCTVLGVDVGRLALTASEVQAYADSAASAAASALLAGRSPGAAVQEALAVGRKNGVDGRAGAPAQVTFGRWDAASALFTPTNVNPSAVRVAATATVRTLLAGIWGQSTATVQKTATAAFAGLGAAAPTLPFVLGDCDFAGLPACFGGNGCLPRVQGAPSAASRTAWTAFLDAPADQANVGAYLPAACGGSKTPPRLAPGDGISLGTQPNDAVLQALAKCVTPGTSAFLIPTVSCTANFAQAGTVTGFATVVIDAVSTAGAKGLTLHAVFRQVPGPPAGCAKCGTGFVTLVG